MLAKKSNEWQTKPGQPVGYSAAVWLEKLLKSASMGDKAAQLAEGWSSHGPT